MNYELLRKRGPSYVNAAFMSWSMRLQKLLQNYELIAYNPDEHARLNNIVLELSNRIGRTQQMMMDEKTGGKFLVN